MNLNPTEKEVCEVLGHSKFQIIDGVVNVFESVFIDDLSLKSLPFRFGEVEGIFDCSNNLLTSLEG